MPLISGKEWSYYRDKVSKPVSYTISKDEIEESARQFNELMKNSPLKPIKKQDLYKPTKVIFSNDVTVCWFADGKKEMVKCTEFDRYSAEAGVAMCIAKHIFGSRNQFKKFVEAEYDKSIDHLAEKAKRNLKKQKKKELNADGNND